MTASKIGRRVVVKGSSGAGKTTLAAELSRRLGVPHIELDGIHHLPGWTAASAERMTAEVTAALAAAPGGWVVDGNYDAKLGDTVVGVADTVVWLDLPLRVKLARVARRTVGRLVGGDRELWNGNRETWRGTFASRDSILLWVIRGHRSKLRGFPERFADDPRVVRLRSAAEVRRWLEGVMPR